MLADLRHDAQFVTLRGSLCKVGDSGTLGRLCRLTDAPLYLLDGITLATLVRQLLDESQTVVIVDKILRIVGQQEVAELIVDILLGGLNDNLGKALVKLVYLLHALLLLLLCDVVTIDIFGNAVDLLANNHHGVVQPLPLVVTRRTADT